MTLCANTHGPHTDAPGSVVDLLSLALLAVWRVGSVVETNKERWAQRILSLPSKKVINSESSACLFKV